jgi:hypothetical protein
MVCASRAARKPPAEWIVAAASDTVKPALGRFIATPACAGVVACGGRVRPARMQGIAEMSASLHTLNFPPRPGGRPPARPGAGPSLAPVASEPAAWIVDQTALQHCRALLLGHGAEFELRALERRAPMLVPMDVPPDYARFCRSHFASVRRLHPELSWDDAVPAYAIALSAHAALCVALDEAREALLERHWDRIRGDSTLGWTRARPLIAAGCSALDRLDPLAMHR